jgi:hypothetical protein
MATPEALGRQANEVLLVGQQVCPAGHSVGLARQLAPPLFAAFVEEHAT